MNTSKKGVGVGSVMANFVTARKYSPRAAFPFFPLAALFLLIGLALVPDTLA